MKELKTNEIGRVIGRSVEESLTRLNVHETTITKDQYSELLAEFFTLGEEYTDEPNHVSLQNQKNQREALSGDLLGSWKPTAHSSSVKRLVLFPLPRCQPLIGH